MRIDYFTIIRIFYLIKNKTLFFFHFFVIYAIMTFLKLAI